MGWERGVVADGWPRCDGKERVVGNSSTRVFQAPQEGQRPKNWWAWEPQAWQR